MLSSETKKTLKGFFRLFLGLLMLAALSAAARQLLYDFLWLDPKAPTAFDASYERALLRQVNALRKTRDNEVIVFGPSYVSFGIDAAEMEKTLSTPVQTLGVEASMGIPILLDMLYRYSQPGDTVVYMLGTSNYSGENTVAVCAALEPDKELIYSYLGSRGLNENHKNQLIWRKLYSLCIGKGVIYMESKLAKKPQVYSIHSFDERGNMIADRPQPLDSLIVPNELLEEDDIDLETMDMLNSFSAWCARNNVRFVICYAPFMEESIANTTEELKSFHEWITSYLDADFINTPQDCLLPKEYFYNHPAHLNSEGARIYSQNLAEKLKNYMEQTP